MTNATVDLGPSSSFSTLLENSIIHFTEEGGAGGAATVAAAVMMVLPFFGTACHAGREGGPPTEPAGGGLTRTGTTTGAPAAALPTVGLEAAGVDAAGVAAAGLDAARVALAAGVEVDAAADAGWLGMLCGRAGGREGAGTAWVAPRWKGFVTGPWVQKPASREWERVRNTADAEQ